MLDLQFAEVNREGQAITIQNVGSGAADLRGCTLISERGDEVYHFPAGTVLEPGAALTVVCRDSTLPGDLIWNEDSVFWNEDSVWKKNGDNALLYDLNMNLLDSNAAA